jgi:Spx/MgsR family transcriptional regulator
MLRPIVAQPACGMMWGMHNPTPVVYGIRNCDTVKRARQWLTAQGVAHQFHDFKLQGVPGQRLDQWLTGVGWQLLLNRQGTTWRKLDDASKAAAMDSASARAVMLAHPSVIKRPVVEWDGTPDGRVTVGFDAPAWLALQHVA